MTYFVLASAVGWPDRKDGVTPMVLLKVEADTQQEAVEIVAAGRPKNQIFGIAESPGIFNAGFAGTFVHPVEFDLKPRVRVRHKTYLTPAVLADSITY